VLAGDLVVRFKIKKHKMFTRKGADLFLDKVITLKEALCGFTFKIKWLGGNVINVATLPGEVISDG